MKKFITALLFLASLQAHAILTPVGGGGGGGAVDSVNGQTGVVVVGTDEVAEGASNLYFLNARAQSACVDNSLTSGITNKAGSQDAVLSAIASAAIPAAPYVFYGDATNGVDAGCDGSFKKKCQTLTALLALATDPSKQYTLRLTNGDYNGVTLAWPPNVGVVGEGTGVNINQPLVYTAQAGDEASFAFDLVGVNSFTLDLTLANIALPVFQNGNYGITRVDATAGPHFIRVENSVAGNTDITGSVAYYNTLFVSSVAIQTGGNLLCTGCIFGTGADMYGTATIQFTASLFVGFLTGHPVGPDTPVMKIDASSNMGGSLSSVDTVYTDQGSAVVNTPAGTVSATTVQAAINELDTEKLATIPQSRTVYVDLDNGNDGTCAVGDVAKPCETIGQAEDLISDASVSKLYLINIGPGNHDVTGLEAKSNIKWKGQGSEVTSVSVTTGSVDLDNAAMASGQNILAFEGISFNSAPIVMDAFSIGGTGQTQFFFYHCIFNSPQTWTGRADAHDAVQFHDVSFSSTPNTFTSMQAAINSSIMTNDGGDKLYVNSANGAGSVMFIQGSVINPEIQVDDGATDDFTLLAFVNSTAVGGLTANGPSSQVVAPGSGFVVDPVMSGGATIDYFRDASQSTYTPSISANWLTVPATVKAGLDNLAAYSPSAPTKQMIKVVQFSNLTSLTAIPLPFAPVAGYELQEGDLLLYDGETPGSPGDYTASGVYKFHDNGDSTGDLTRAPDWALGATIQKGTLIHVAYNDDNRLGTDTWLEIPATVTVGAGDILPSGYNYVGNVDHISSSGTYKLVVNLVATVDVPLTGLAPGTVVGGVPIANNHKVFLTNQTNPVENGVYRYRAGPQDLIRAVDWPVGQTINNETMMAVNGGGDYSGALLFIDFFVIGDGTGPLTFRDVVSSTLDHQLRYASGNLFADFKAGAAVINNPDGEPVIDVSSPDQTTRIHGHLLVTQATPPTPTVDGNAGTGGTCDLVAGGDADMAGQVKIVVGTAPSTGSYCSIAFATPHVAPPICILTPASANLSSNVYVTASNTDFQVNFAVAGLGTYNMNYHCIETQ